MNSVNTASDQGLHCSPLTCCWTHPMFSYWIELSNVGWFQHSRVFRYFSFFSKKTCSGYLKEVPRRGSSNENQACFCWETRRIQMKKRPSRAMFQTNNPIVYHTCNLLRKMFTYRKSIHMNNMQLAGKSTDDWWEDTSKQILTHLCQVDSSTITLSTGLFPIAGPLVIFHYYCFIESPVLNANSVDPDQMLTLQHLIWVYTVCNKWVNAYANCYPDQHLL